jgi:hypothetical protein
MTTRRANVKRELGIMKKVATENNLRKEEVVIP